MTIYGRDLLPLWQLEDDMIFLNHGSYGATPKEVLAEQDVWRQRLERQPVRFINTELPHALRTAAGRLATFVGAQPENLAFVENASSGIGAVLRSLPFGRDDEIVTTSHVYNAVRNALAHTAALSGIAVREAFISMPLTGDAPVLDAIERVMSRRTRLLVVDHVASASAAVLPIAEIVGLAHASGVPVLVDGAHAPGMLDLDVEATAADWYVGNCHKWLCAPKGAGFLVTTPQAPYPINPLVISHAYGEGFTAQFDRVGTRDCSAWLAVPAAIAFHERLGGPVLRARNRALAHAAGLRLAEALGSNVGLGEAQTGAMASVRLPWTGPVDWPTARALKERLWSTHRIDIHVTCLADALWLRLSFAAYNDLSDVDPLPQALRATMAAFA